MCDGGYMDETVYVEHILRPDGRCVVSINGQGHMPCDIHVSKEK